MLDGRVLTAGLTSWAGGRPAVGRLRTGAEVFLRLSNGSAGGGGRARLL